MVTGDVVRCVERGAPRRALITGAAVALVAAAALPGCGSNSEQEAAGDSLSSVPADASSTTVHAGTATGSEARETAPAATTVAAVTSLESIEAPATATAGAERELVLDQFEFFVPDGWTPQYSAVIGTEFQAEAKSCVSAEVVDDPSPPDSGAAALERAAIQICIVEQDDELTLEQWLTQRNQAGWLAAQYGTCAVMSLPGTPEQQLAYVQSAEARAEIAITVTTTAEMMAQRRAEVADLLENMRCTTN